jgi:shikimate kinase
MKGPIYIIGLMGAGKTTMGRHLAQLLNWSWVDLDHAVEKRSKRSVAAIFKDLGEGAFRRLEAQELRRQARRPLQVISCGGGVVLRPENRRLLKRSLTLYLAISPAALAKRLRGPGKENRPLLRGREVLPILRRMQQERARIYRANARFVLRATGRPEAVAERAFRKVSLTLTPKRRRVTLLKP